MPAAFGTPASSPAGDRLRVPSPPEPSSTSTRATTLAAASRTTEPWPAGEPTTSARPKRLRGLTSPLTRAVTTVAPSLRTAPWHAGAVRTMTVASLPREPFPPSAWGRRTVAPSPRTEPWPVGAGIWMARPKRPWVAFYVSLPAVSIPARCGRTARFFAGEEGTTARCRCSLRRTRWRMESSGSPIPRPSRGRAVRNPLRSPWPPEPYRTA